MSASLTYNRPKSTQVNSTALVTTLAVAEKPDSPTAITGNGTTGALDARIRMDADESGGTDVQDVFKIEATPTIDSSLGTITVTVVVTPIKGDGSAGTPQTLTVTHGENADAWQTAAGRARQS